FGDGQQAQVTGVSQLTRSKQATIARVQAKNFTDYGAVGLGPQQEGKVHVLADRADGKALFAFKGYGYLRVKADGSVRARGGWTAVSIPRARGPLTLNGKQVPAQFEDGYLVYGSPSRQPDQVFRESPPAPLNVTFLPDVVRLLPRDSRTVILHITNPLNQ